MLPSRHILPKNEKTDSLFKTFDKQKLQGCFRDFTIKTLYNMAFNKFQKSGSWF